MNEEKTEENTATRGEPRALRRGAAGALEGGRLRGAGARASPPARLLLPLRRPALLSRETSRGESQPGLPPAPSARALGSLRGCPSGPNQLGWRARRRAPLARSSVEWALKAGASRAASPTRGGGAQGHSPRAASRWSLGLQVG